MFYNFFALGNDEFEELSRDILSRDLGQEMRIFGKGADQGIDIADCKDGRTIIAQCKNYIDTPTSKLMSALTEEREKIEKLNPTEYYLFINKDISPQKINNIYELFQEWMPSKKNIYTRSDCDAFISKKENQDIAQRYPNILNMNSLHDLINSSTVIDNQDLLISSRVLSKLFVPTQQYHIAMSLLENNHIVLISGAPGTGKTISSKMLATQFVYYGKYSLRFSEGEDLHRIKDELSPHLDQKEFIFIDDVFGQHYHDMTNSNESLLKQIIRRVNNSPNKRMLVNTRMTILQEARQRFNFADESVSGEEPFTTVDMTDITPLEKAEIFVNHLRCRNVDRNYINVIKDNYNYRDIVQHENYTPRIIDRCTQQKFVHKTEPNKYTSHILDTLNHANAIWDDEFRHNLSSTDRILLYTLYSLTNQQVPEEVLRRAVNARINPSSELYESVNINDILQRLNESMITITHRNNVRMIGVINPSVNDYLRTYLYQAPEERERIIAHATFMEQIERIVECTDDIAYEEEKITQLLDSFISGKDAPAYSVSNDSATYVNAALLVLIKQLKNITVNMKSPRFLTIANKFMNSVLQGKLGFIDDGISFKTSKGYIWESSSFLPDALHVLKKLDVDYGIFDQWKGDKESLENVLSASDGLEIKSQVCALFYDKALSKLDQSHWDTLEDVIIDNLDAEIEFIQESATVDDYCVIDASDYDDLSYLDEDTVWEIANDLADAVQQDIDEQIFDLPQELQSQLRTVDAYYYQDEVKNTLKQLTEPEDEEKTSPIQKPIHSNTDNLIDELFREL